MIRYSMGWKTKEARDAYRAKNKKRLQAQQRAWFRKNKKKHARWRKAYKAKQKRRIAKRQKAYYRENKARILKKRKAYYRNNKARISAINAEWSRKNRTKRRAYLHQWRRRDRRNKVLERLRAQDFRCANLGCRIRIAVKGRTRTRTACNDHCHKTGDSRGLLCWSCNVALGHLLDDPARARGLATYLTKHQRKNGTKQ